MGARGEGIAGGPTAVYRLYDRAGDLLYVGISQNPDDRMKAHRSKPWGELIRWWEYRWCPTRAGALAVEWAAINSENPRYNADRFMPYVDREFWDMALENSRIDEEWAM